MGVIIPIATKYFGVEFYYFCMPNLSSENEREREKNNNINIGHFVCLIYLSVTHQDSAHPLLGPNYSREDVDHYIQVCMKVTRFLLILSNEESSTFFNLTDSLPLE